MRRPTTGALDGGVQRTLANPRLRWAVSEAILVLMVAAMLVYSWAVRYDLLVFLLPAQSPACLVHPKECELIVGSRAGEPLG